MVSASPMIAADRHARIERGERVLEDDLHVAAERAERRGIELRDVAALEPDLAGGRLDQPQDAAAGRRLARAGFADQPERLARRDVEAHIVDRVHHAGRRAPEQPPPTCEVLGQILDAQQRLNRLSHRAAISSAARCSTQATLWPPPTSRSGGTASRHFGIA